MCRRAVNGADLAPALEYVDVNSILHNQIYLHIQSLVCTLAGFHLEWTDHLYYYILSVQRLTPGVP